MDLDRERLKGMRKQIKAGATGAVRNLLEDMNVFEDRKKKVVLKTQDCRFSTRWFCRDVKVRYNMFHIVVLCLLRICFYSEAKLGGEKVGTVICFIMFRPLCLLCIEGC